MSTPAERHTGSADAAGRAVITVGYGSELQLEPFFDSLPEASSVPLQAIVADNLPSSAGTERIAREHGVEYLPLPANPGYGGAVNAASKQLSDDVGWILVSNPDVVLAPGVIDALVATAASDSRIGSVGPLIRNADGSVYPSARTLPSLRTGVGHALFARIWPENPWTRQYHAADQAVETRDAGWLSGACVLIRRSAFESIGGFDEEFFMYFEDVDLGFRLAHAGWRNVYEPSAEVLHTGAHSTGGDSSQAMLQAHHRSARRFIEKKYAHPLLFPLRAGLSLGLGIRESWHARSLRREHG